MIRLVSGGLPPDEKCTKKRHSVRRTPNKSAAIPIQKQPFSVMVRRRRAEVKVSTLSAAHKRELVKAKDKELNAFVKYILWSRRHHVKGSHRLR